MSVHKLSNGQSATVASTQWDGDALDFAGNSGAAGSAPVAMFSGTNVLSLVSDQGTAAAHGVGIIDLNPGGALSIDSLNVNAATLVINERPNAAVTLNGITDILNGSTLNATGYGGAGGYAVDGTMNIDGSSTVNMDYVNVTGSGGFHLTGNNALLRLGNVASGDTVVLDGGMLSLTNGMGFLGTITDSTPAASRIGASASVDVYNAMAATQATFDRSTGMFSLTDASGDPLASLKFAGTGDLYATPVSGLATDYVAITSHQSTNSLHTRVIG